MDRARPDPINVPPDRRARPEEVTGTALRVLNAAWANARGVKAHKLRSYPFVANPLRSRFITYPIGELEQLFGIYIREFAPRPRCRRSARRRCAHACQGSRGFGNEHPDLQRRRSADGLAYQDLVLDARKTLSEQLLRRTDYALAEIAILTGFSNQSAFTRAFKRWHGQTPANYRRGA
ncbi:MAG: helix-turn-helix transcriptional regulator [Paracoccaceae bacterium]